MKTKLLLSIAVVSALSLGAFGADYSKFSNDELVGLSGKVAPKDYPDYRMEIHKRVQEMKVKDADVFRDKLWQARQNAYDAMSVKERREYHDAVRVEMQKRLDTMTVQEAREKGFMRGHGYGHRGYGNHRAGRGYGNCPLN